MSLSPKPIAQAEPPQELLPTHVAAARNDLQELSRLFSANETTLDPKTKETPLHAAARTGSVGALKWLLENNVASPTAKATNGNTAAHYAAVYGHLDALKLMLTYEPNLSDQIVVQTDENGLSILSLATLQGDEDMAKWILDNFASVVDIPNSNGNLAIHFAAAQGQLPILKLLVKKCGKEIAEKSDTRLTTPVFFASQEGKLDVLDYLVNELEVDPVARDKAGMSSVHAATQGGQTNTVKWLISKLGSKYILDKTVDGATPLHMAAALGHMEILKIFLGYVDDKESINVQDHIHATPAHDAAEYGQTQAMLLLLKHGADITIRDAENKTPHELAVEQNHSEVAAMIADYRDNGAIILSNYEKKKSRRQKYDGSDVNRPHTNRHEADELSNVIDQTTAVVEQRKEKELQRQESLQRMNEVGRDDNGDSTEQKKKSSGGHKHQNSYQGDDEEDDIEHTLGPKGDLYARPKKRKHHGHGSHQNSDIDDFISETMSHRSYASAKHHPPGFLPVDDGPYATVNHETASNYSRPSRVKRYHDSDSELSSFPGSAGQHYSDGRHNIPRFYPPYNPMYPPQVHVPPPQSHISSRHSSQGSRSHHQGYMMPPMPMAYPAPYGYGLPGMIPGYYGAYPGYPTPYGAHPGYGGRPKTTEERMHMAALQHSHPPPQMMPGYSHPDQYFQQGRRSVLMKEKKVGSKPLASKQHTDQDIGYGPSITSAVAKAEDDHFHPPAPPVTHRDGTVEDTDMVKFDSNFIMLKKSGTGEVRQVGGTTLNPAKATPAAYDGRYDEFIMTDSEEEHEIDEQYSVGYAAEVAAIIAIGCVAGLRGLTKMRKLKKGAVVDMKSDKPHMATAWETVPSDMGKRGSRRGSLSGIEDPKLKGMSEEDYANREEWEDKNAWEKKGKSKQNKNADDTGTAQSDNVLEKPQSELLTAEQQKQSYESVSKHFGQKILTDALGARESSMLNIAAASGFGSRMSLNQTSDEDDDDDFGDAISIVHGMLPGERKKAHHGEEPITMQVAIASPEDEQPTKEESKKEQKKEKKAKKKEKKEKKSKESKRNKEAKDGKAQKQPEPEQEQKEPTKKAGDKKDKGKGRKWIVKPSPPQAQMEPEVTLKSLDSPKTTDRKAHRSNKKTPAAVPREMSKEVEIRQTETEHTVSVSVAVQKLSSGKSNAPRDVKNPAFPDSDDESLKRRSKISSSKFDGIGTTIVDADIHRKPITSEKTPQQQPQSAIKMTDQEKEIFGEEAFDELNDVLRQLDDIQAGLFTTVTNPVAATTKDVGTVATPVKSASASKESDSEVAYELSKQIATQPEQTEWIEAKQYERNYTSATSHEQMVSANGKQNEVRFPIDGENSSKDHSISLLASKAVNQSQMVAAPQPVPTQQQEGLLSTAQADAQTSTYSNTFEHNVLETLAALNETMQQMKSNPSVTQTAIIQQQKIQQTLIQNLLSSTQHDPSLTSKLLTMLDKSTEGNVKSGSIPLENLEHKLLNAQERQLQEAQEHFRTQSEFQHSIQRKLEEQAQQQMQGIEANFEKYTKLLEEQMAEQRKNWEMELLQREEAKLKHDKKADKKRRTKGKKHKKERRHQKHSSDSESSSSDDGLLQPTPKTVAFKPAVKTMQAKIYSQDLLDEANFQTPSKPTVGNITGKNRQLMRRDTQYEFGRTTDALRKFESIDDDEDDDELQYQHAKPITLKRADIKVQDSSEYTPQRGGAKGATTDQTSNGVRLAHNEPKSSSTDFHMLKQKTIKHLDNEAPVEVYDEAKLKFGHHVEPNPKKDFDRSNTAGAGSELAAVLRLRSKQVDTRK